MFDIGFLELVVIAAIGLIVIGPKRLPEVVRSISLWIGRLRRSIGNIKRGIESEFQLDEVRRQLHNEEILQQLNATKDEIELAVNGTREEHDYEPIPRDNDTELPPAPEKPAVDSPSVDSPPVNSPPADKE